MQICKILFHKRSHKVTTQVRMDEFKTYQFLPGYLIWNFLSGHSVGIEPTTNKKKTKNLLSAHT